MGVYINGSKLNFSRNYKYKTYKTNETPITSANISFSSHYEAYIKSLGNCVYDMTQNPYICVRFLLSEVQVSNDLSFMSVEKPSVIDSSLFSFDSDTRIIWSWYGAQTQSSNGLPWYYQYAEKLNSGNFTVTFSKNETYGYIKIWVKDMTKLQDYQKAITDPEYGTENKKYLKFYAIVGNLKYNGKYIVWDRSGSTAPYTLSLDGQNSSVLYAYPGRFGTQHYPVRPGDTFVYYITSPTEGAEQLANTQIISSGDAVSISVSASKSIGYFHWFISFDATGGNNYTDNWPLRSGPSSTTGEKYIFNLENVAGYTKILMRERKEIDYE